MSAHEYFIIKVAINWDTHGAHHIEVFAPGANKEELIARFKSATLAFVYI